mgnify:CR=1 FL=1
MNGVKELKYSSTRGKAASVASAEAIIQGLAADGGLFVPEEMPKVDPDFIAGMRQLSYEERAARILGLFLTDYMSEELAGCIARAYGDGKFDDVRIAPVHALKEFPVLELWHGPTSAFKDMALQLLPQLLQTALKKTGEDAEILILVATSGDTGKAALEGFADVDQIKILVFYPTGGVSKIQNLQMCTQKGANVRVVAVKGNFDDAQNGVKEIFSDKAFGEKLASENVKLSSANSINWGRLVPQIVYYFSAYADLLEKGTIAAGESIDFCVPTGNFGDILAGYYAKRMGLPVAKLICASNSNNVLTDFLQTGVYDKKRDFYKTISPSMDILISSNLERLLYHLTEDTAEVAAWMKQLTEVGKYDASRLLPALKENFWAAFADDAATEQEIRAVYERTHYTLDTHTAVAYRAAEAYRRETGDTRPMIVLSTASPYKFGASVLHALGEDTAGMDEFAQMERLHARSGMAVPPRLAALRTASVLHKGICAKDDMRAEVLSFARA